jgi:hypothetical protein
MADGLGLAGFSGALSGAGKGAQLGSIIPGVGTAAGAAGGALLGGITSMIGQNKANKAQEVPFADPMDIKRRAELEQVRKSLMVGTDPGTQLGIQSAQAIARGVQNPIVRSTGGDVSATMDALLKTQKNAQGAANQAIAEGRQSIPFFETAYGNLASTINQRKLELALLNRSQATAENAQARTDQNVNANALLATQGGTQTIPEAVNSLNIPQWLQSRFGQSAPTSSQVGVSANTSIPTEMNMGQQVPLINPTSGTIETMNWGGGLSNQALPSLMSF